MMVNSIKLSRVVTKQRHHIFCNFIALVNDHEYTEENNGIVFTVGRMVEAN